MSITSWSVCLTLAIGNLVEVVIAFLSNCSRVHSGTFELEPIFERYICHLVLVWF